MTDVARLLSDLTDVAATLNRESDDLSSLIDRFETTLADLRLGLEVWLEKPILTGPCEDDNGVPVGTLQTFLGYARGKQGWGLYLSDHLGGGEIGKERLRDASRAERIAAVAAFPDLLAAMKQAAEQAIAEIRRVTKPGSPQAEASTGKVPATDADGVRVGTLRRRERRGQEVTCPYCGKRVRTLDPDGACATCQALRENARAMWAHGELRIADDYGKPLTGRIPIDPAPGVAGLCALCKTQIAAEHEQEARLGQDGRPLRFHARPCFAVVQDLG